jgi:hypothetical protein
MLSGKEPKSLLLLASKTVTFLSNPISLGKHERKPLFMRITSFRVLDMLTKLVGKHPWNLLFARTITETGELPKLSGNSRANLLWFMNIASRSLSNSSFGKSPSNSLNRRSRYLSFGRSRTTYGNLPAKRLLLRSSS